MRSNDVMCEGERVEGYTWHHDLVMMKAKGLAVFAEENWPVRRGQGIVGYGSEVCIPMLLAFAAELALKAWKLREEDGPPKRTHNLIELFMDLDEAGRKRLKLASEARVVSVVDLEWTYSGIEEVLETCQNKFVDWRYSHERKKTIIDSGSLLVAVKDIVVEYERDGKTVYQILQKASEAALRAWWFRDELRGQEESE